MKIYYKRHKICTSAGRLKDKFVKNKEKLDNEHDNQNKKKKMFQQLRAKKWWKHTNKSWSGAKALSGSETDQGIKHPFN